ncbi:MAG: glutamate-5-semialdehyde dehydrogenase [Chloroflexi bacterium]|nr:glutamate-5-semialdehyde dehydrogenase [Chloroflexota bacterium]
MLEEMGKRARAAARKLARETTAEKNASLERMAAELWADRAHILAANAFDVEAAREVGLSSALLDRLTLNESRLQGTITDLRGVAALPDPVGETFDQGILPNGLRVRKQRVPIGVLGVIYEARPNVTVDVAGLAVKTGNSAILRGGSETLESNKALLETLRKALEESGLPADAVQLIADPDRARVAELLGLYEYVDLIIPRGGAALHRFCRETSKIPVITGGIGICHLYVDASADLEAALPVLRNAKIQRPTVCNALDTLLVHRSIASVFLPRLVEALKGDGVSFRAHANALPYVQQDRTGHVQPAGPEDFDTEWLSLVLGIKVVENLDEAVEHITLHSTGHSDGILTQDVENARRFTSEVDSAVVYVNASTRFTDGAQLGLGAEAAVSTQRLHARGPMGPRELTTYKWVVEGDYHIRTT